MNPYLLDLKPEDVASWPEDVQSQLLSDFDPEIELEFVPEEDKSAFLQKVEDWFAQYRSLKASSASSPSAPTSPPPAPTTQT